MSNQEHEPLRVSPRFHLGHGLYGRVLEHQDGHNELAILIDDDGFVTRIRRARRHIHGLRTYLTHLHGTDVRESHDALLAMCAQLQAAGWKSTAIAMYLNYRCLVTLCYASAEGRLPGTRTMGSVGIVQATVLLKRLGMTDMAITDALMPALAQIQQGHAPWPLEQGPVTWMRVWQALRHWTQTHPGAHGTVTVAARGGVSGAATGTLLAPPHRRYYAQANALMRQDYPESFAQYTEHVWQLLQGLHQPGMDQP
jgi:hypothetical protein